MKNLKYCEILEKLKSDPRTYPVYDSCIDENFVSFQTIYLREILVEFLEKARIMYEEYRHNLNATEIDALVTDFRHDYFLEMSSNFARIFLYEEIFGIEKSAQQQISWFKAGVIVPCVLMIPVLFLIYQSCLKRYRRELFCHTSKIRVIFELISFAEIEADKGLRTSIERNADVFKFLN